MVFVKALEAHPTIHDELPHRILTGSVQVRPDVRRFTPTGVVFEGGLHEEVDVVIMATGYDYTFPMLDKQILNTEANGVRLYKYTFPLDLKHATLSIIGLVQPIGAVMPVSEMQARWFSMIMA
ncbi:PREDICTED: dimethylaniline monooxygenase [N-oxide-forming] 5-like, partial [Priapulus caudatus]|uniref:Flavin-containing monooxygenase n=1 Tax=Priapulus caudatus TaxID=37621 RepID=A0ABM1F6F5_PRICU